MTDERQRAIRNVGWASLEKWGVRLAGVGTFVVMSRLLAPEEIGLAALAVAVVGLLGVLADFGLSTYLVQRPDEDPVSSTTVFWTTATLGVLFALALVAGAGPAARLLGEPDAAPVLRALSAGLVLSALTVVPAALLVRRMRFRVMAARGLAAALASAVVGITLASQGAGVWALVAQTLTHNVVSLVWFWRAAAWVPGRSVSRDVLRETWRFGSAALGINLLQAVRDRADQFLIGGILGVEALGFWAVATRVVYLLHEVTMTVLDHVALPLLSRLQHEEERFARAYEAAVSASTALLTPALAVLAVVTPAVLPFLFGDVWEPAVAPAQVLCVAYAVGGVGYFNRAALLARGRAGVAWWIAVASLVVHVGVLATAGPFGLTAFAAASAVATTAIVLGSAVVLRRVLGVGWWVYARGVRALLAAAASTLPMLAVTAAVGGMAGAVVAAVTGLLCYLLLMALVNRSLVRDGLRDVRGLLAR